MSEILCPVCGKSNPDDEEVCQFCSARLKPIWKDESSNQSDSSAGIEGDDFPEWLSSIAPLPHDKESQDDSVPEWLQGLRDEVRLEKDFEPSEDLTEIASIENLDERHVPEWLKDVFLDSDEATRGYTESDSQFENEKQETDRLLSSPSDEILARGKPGLEIPGQIEDSQGKEIHGTDGESGEFVDKSDETVPEIHTESDSELEISEQASQKEETTDPDSEAIDQQESLMEDDSKTPGQFGDFGESTKLSFEPTMQSKKVIPEEATFDFDQLEQDARLSEGIEKQDIFTGDLSWLEGHETDPAFVPTASEEIEEEETKEEAAAEKADEFPEWLKDAMQPGIDRTPSAFSSEETQEEIPPAELPSWLKSLRPVGALDLDRSEEKENSGKIENAGPLAGIAGVLSSEPDILQSVKPPVYSQKLNISDTQQLHSNLLAQLIQTESEGKPLPHPPNLKSQSLLRICIALVLFTVVIVSLLINPSIIKTPGLSSEVYLANDIISNLPPGQPVLIAIDYSPGYSHELESILRPVIEQLHSKDAILTLVSTIPTGPTQAERLAQQAMGQSASSGVKQSTNLGFVPGGASGLVAFAQNPKQVFPYDSRGRAAWSNEMLQEINTIADYAMIFVATENPEVARYWIEQVQPLSKNIPFMMVVSAQSMPIIQPYYEAVPQQVQGLLGGISAAVQYETLLGQPNKISAFWSSLIISLGASLILILIGALINAYAGYLSRKKTIHINDRKA